ncbi:uncharacterized protein LOC110751966 isoform X2 [Prunus avium]|uniref:Uncharacterized protein LOC110751966 isoform X2 n=1 Tax=Prunus avium TaxID=42229 RepID=A0A6P5S309_PRUAV|nr:uncharacterized protein LOC110751966 isoform X2 [Prunus avium]
MGIAFLSMKLDSEQKKKKKRGLMSFFSEFTNLSVEVSGSNPSADAKLRRAYSQKDKLRVERETLQAVLEQCQRALESLDTTGGADGDGDGEDDGEDEDDDDDNCSRGAVDDDESQQGRRSTSSRPNCEADESFIVLTP